MNDHALPETPDVPNEIPAILPEQANDSFHEPPTPSMEAPPEGISPFAPLLLFGVLLLAVPYGMLYGLLTWLIPSIQLTFVIACLAGFGAVFAILLTIQLSRLRSKLLLVPFALLAGSLAVYMSSVFTVYLDFRAAGMPASAMLKVACRPDAVWKYTCHKATHTYISSNRGPNDAPHVPNTADLVIAWIIILGHVIALAGTPTVFALIVDPDKKASEIPPEQQAPPVTSYFEKTKEESVETG